MKKRFLLAPLLYSLTTHAALNPVALKTADYAVEHYQTHQIHTLANMVSFETVNLPNIKAPKNTEFIGFKQLLKIKADEFGLTFQDFGYTVLITMGDQKDKVTVVTHGDVQPADPSKWQQSPFKLDTTSEPGKLIARGTEDDKGAIATALYAMKAIKDNDIQLKNRIELMVYLAEESDWQPLREFMKTYHQPKYAVTIDASYPVVVAEKGWSLLTTEFKNSVDFDNSKLYASDFKGGAFKSQIPEDASIRLYNLTPHQASQLKNKAAQLKPVQFNFDKVDDHYLITARGISAHSSEPEAGVNAIAYLAQLVDGLPLEQNATKDALSFFNQLLGLTIYGEQFGDIAYRHDFMGPMTVSPTLLETSEQSLTLHVNMRRPVGKEKSQLESEIWQALNTLQKEQQLTIHNTKLTIGEPMLLDSTPHAHKLLSIFKHFTGDQNASFVSIGGGTNAKLFENAVSFGPSMPGQKYTGHSEHEFLTEQQMALNLRMYTSMMIELGNM